MRTIEASGVSVAFRGVQALDDVSVGLEAGRVTMLAGPNGAGKSTLIKFMLGLVRAQQGRIVVDGRAVAIDNVWKSRVGYLPESVAFSENLSGQQVLRFFANARGVSRERVEQALDVVGLAAASGRRVHGYSRGMRQRLGLAIATLSLPELLILDEPTAGLDQEGLGVLWRVLADWREAGRHVLVSSHDLALMERRIDSLCVLRDGRLIAQGDKDDLRRRAHLPHRVWFDVEGTEEERIDLLCGAMRKWGRGTVERFDGRLCVEVSQESILDLMEIQRGFAGAVRGLRVEEPTMDLVFEKLLEVA
jgi:Cu-processing system ATP-binding protein